MLETIGCVFTLLSALKKVFSKGEESLWRPYGWIIYDSKCTNKPKVHVLRYGSCWCVGVPWIFVRVIDFLWKCLEETLRLRSLYIHFYIFILYILGSFCSVPEMFMRLYWLLKMAENRGWNWHKQVKMWFLNMPNIHYSVLDFSLNG